MRVASPRRCPRCGWEGGEEAFFCARCGAALGAVTREAWYYRTSVLVLAFLAVGPFAVPLVWMNPRFGAAKKVAITALMAVITALLAVLFAYSLKEISALYSIPTDFYAPAAMQHPPPQHVAPRYGGND